MPRFGRGTLCAFQTPNRGHIAFAITSARRRSSSADSAAQAQALQMGIQIAWAQYRGFVDQFDEISGSRPSHQP